MSLTGSSLQISASIICQKCLIEKKVDFHLEQSSLNHRPSYGESIGDSGHRPFYQYPVKSLQNWA
jgi:hypothetical protein